MMKKIGYYLCKYLGWHKPDEGRHLLGGFQPVSICIYCDKTILLDSQGNWF